MSIIVAVAVICRPTDRSNLLSYASQLPMDDPGLLLQELVCDIDFKSCCSSQTLTLTLKME